MKRRAARKWKEWRVLDIGGSLYMDAYYYKKVAQQRANNVDGKVIRVEVRETPHRRGR